MDQLSQDSQNVEGGKLDKSFSRLSESNQSSIQSLNSNQKSLILFVLMINQIANGSIYLNVATFLPLYCK